jgi:cation diffusion facilitator family transporter
MGGIASLMVGIAALGLKFWAYELTNSQAVLSDALESIVNVVAAGFALIVIHYAARPPDDEHPYGHGKTEFFSAAFEGGLVVFAAVLILIDSALALTTGHVVREADTGLIVLGAAGLLNFALGAALLRVGRNQNSPTLEASGQHVLSDVWTTGAALVGLMLVHFTGAQWIDPLLGLGAGAYLGFVGLRILRASVGGLLDEQNRDVLSHLGTAIDEVRRPGMIGVHGARIMRSGTYHYIDAHVIVPEFWDVRHSHDEVNRFERDAMERYKYKGEIHFHIDPCRRNYCKKCNVSDCQIRRDDFKEKIVHSLQEIVADSSTRD